MNTIVAILTDPRLLEAEEALAVLALPPPYGELVAAALRAVEAAVQAGVDASEFNAITAKYSAQAQAIADAWPAPVVPGGR